MGKGMRAGKKPKAQGMGNMQKQMQQMQAMQRKGRISSVPLSPH